MSVHTYGELIDDIHAHFDYDPQVDLDVVSRLAKVQYLHFKNHTEWSGPRAEFTINTVAQITSTTSDTITATLDSSTITSAGTPFTSAMVGRQIQLNTEQQYYFVNAFTSTSEITIGDGNSNAVTWPRTTEAGMGWRIFQTIYTLPTDCSKPLTFAGRHRVHELDGGRATLDDLDPERSQTGDHFDHEGGWIHAGFNSSGVRQIEGTPVPTIARTYRGLYLQDGGDLTPASIVDVDYAPFITHSVKSVELYMFRNLGDERFLLSRDRSSSEAKEMADSARFVDTSRRSPVRSMKPSRNHGRRRGGTDYSADHFIF